MIRGWLIAALLSLVLYVLPITAYVVLTCRADVRRERQLDEFVRNNFAI